MFVVTGVGSSLAVLLATTSQFPGKVSFFFYSLLWFCVFVDRV